jgi:putative ATP-binding cassette transporter
MNRIDRHLWRRFLGIAKPYWFSEEKWGARGLLAVLLFFLLALNGLNVLLSYVGRDFMTAIANKNTSSFFHLVFVYLIVFLMGTPIQVFNDYLTSKLGLYWRRWLTNHFLNKYFRNRAFYEVNSNPQIDNPDERISQDINAFTRGALSYSLTIIGSIITFISFVGILWSISTTLVIITILYSFFGTIITVFFGQRLIGLNFNQLRREADFRYKLVHVRDNAEMIAFFGGEEQELSQVWRRFTEAFNNFNLLIGWQRNLGFFTTEYSYLIMIIPSLVIAPLYFTGKVQFGVISQANLAFTQVLGALSLVVSQFQDLSAFISQINRLGTFREILEVPTPSNQMRGTSIDTAIDSRLALEHVTLLTPDYQRTLVKDLSFTVQPGAGLLIFGF